MNQLKEFYKDKKVLVTGHTGFKGSWLCSWLTSMGADVHGIALEPITKPSLFEALGLEEKLGSSQMIDVRNGEEIKACIHQIQPDVVFHLAAQALVKKSYEEPVDTWATNLMGSVNVLNSFRDYDRECAVIMITSDKCYENVEWIWGYRENDQIGGIDPYSASKGATEVAIRSFQKSYFGEDSKVRVSSVRAGNVIGGGDWSLDRIVPDCFRAWSKKEKPLIRNPQSTRPWQHVLEPLSGYLYLGCMLYKSKDLSGEPFNFGPRADEDYCVGELVDAMCTFWPGAAWTDGSTKGSGPYESNLLKLSCDKAKKYLNWISTLKFIETVELTTNWYVNFYEDKNDVFEFTTGQIEKYTQIAKERGIAWAQ